MKARKLKAVAEKHAYSARFNGAAPLKARKPRRLGLSGLCDSASMGPRR